MFEVEINKWNEKENLPQEFLSDCVQEKLKHVHDLKNDLREKG